MHLAEPKTQESTTDFTDDTDEKGIELSICVIGAIRG
jgi:hypothetical protein